MRTDSPRKVLEKLATGDKATIVIERQTELKCAFCDLRSGAVLIKINQMARAATMKNLCPGIGLFTAVWLFSG